MPRKPAMPLHDPILPHQVDFSAIRAQGPGGQNVHKVSSAVHLRFDVAASTLPQAVKDRLLALSDQRISGEGVVIIKVQSTRSQAQNRVEALARLNDLVASAAHVPKARRATKPTYGSRQRRLQGKAVRAEVKANRGRVVD